MDSEGREPSSGAGEDGADAAERAFEALREEVAAQRLVLERLAATLRVQAPRVAPVAPDYSLTLGSMAKSLRTMQERLAAIEGKPALELTPDAYRGQIMEAGRSAGDGANRTLSEGAAAMRRVTGDLRELVRSGRSAQAQKNWLYIVGSVCVLLGMLLWPLFIVVLPVNVAQTLAVTPLNGGDRWQAGQAMMRNFDPDTWNRMAGLYNACGKQSTEACKATMAVRTVPAVPVEPEAADQPSRSVAPASRRRPRR